VQLLVLEILASTGAQENHFLDHVGTLNQGFIYHYWVLALKKVSTTQTPIRTPLSIKILILVHVSTCSVKIISYLNERIERYIIQ
jgi:hypothetical protein